MANPNITITTAANGSTWLRPPDCATRREVAPGDQPRRVEPAHRVADDPGRVVPPAMSTTREASGITRSDSWLATSTVTPEAAA